MEPHWSTTTAVAVDRHRWDVGLGDLAMAAISDRATLQSRRARRITCCRCLEELRSEGYKPVHDIVGNGFNIDHVIVGPGGVFAIETKYRSGKGEITVRNEGVFVDDRLEEKDCLKQALAKR